MKLAMTTAEYDAIGIESEIFVRSSAAWSRARRDKKGVLGKLSDAALDEFESSMGFGKISGVLLRANCTKISEEIGDEIYKFFEIFGADQKIMGTFYPYKCNYGNGGCDSYPGFYCYKNENERCTS